MAIYADVGGVQKVVTTPHCNVGGTWYAADRVFQRRAGAWELVWPAPAVIDLTPTTPDWETVSLSWSVSGVLVDHYEVLRDGQVLVAQQQGTTYTDTDRLGGTTYTYTVRGYRDGNIAAEATGQATTPARADMGLASGTVTWDSVGLAWTDADQGSADSYRLRRGGVVIAEGLAVKSYTDAGRSPSTSHTYLVEALRGAVVVGTDTVDVTTPAYPSLGFTATATAWNSISLAWAALDGEADQAVLDRGTTNIYQGAGTSHTDGSRSASTTYTYTLEHRRSGVVLASSTKSATTPARPTTQKVVTLSPTSGGSYNKSGRRWGIGGGAYYSGYYSSTHGRQYSCFHYAIPSDVRASGGNVSVDKVEFTIQNDHSYGGTGRTQHLAISHTQTAGASNPGSTGTFGGRWTAKDGWYGGAQWVDITNDVEPTYSDTVRNNFRNRGAWGIHLRAPSDSQSYYGYFRNSPVPQLRITYTVYA